MAITLPDCHPRGGLRTNCLAALQNGGLLAAAALLCLALLSGAAVLAAGASPAYADGGANEVNTQQLPDSSFIYDTSISDLESADAYYNNQTVQVVGEVVGDRISAGLDSAHCWITLAATTQGGGTITVYMTNEQADLIDTYGAYGRVGTKVQARGTFSLVCGMHEGLTDLHAESVTVVEKGRQTPDGFNAASFIPGVVVTAIGAALAAVFYYLRERRR